MLVVVDCVVGDAVVIDNLAGADLSRARALHGHHLHMLEDLCLSFELSLQFGYL